MVSWGSLFTLQLIYEVNLTTKLALPQEFLYVQEGPMQLPAFRRKEDIAMETKFLKRIGKIAPESVRKSEEMISKCSALHASSSTENIGTGTALLILLVT